MTSIPNAGEKINEVSGPVNSAESLIEAIENKRNFPNWILAYREWAEPSTDAPLSFIAWGALFSIASVIKRRVKISRDIIGSFEVYPHIFLMFVGPPGLRKTASIENFSLPLMTGVPNVQLGATYFTKETFITSLTSYPDSSCSLVIGEFGDLMQKNKPAEMYDFLITLFDGGSKEQLTVSTFKRGDEIAVKPCVNMVAATTRGWITENMTSNAINGGFSSRVIYVNETELRDNGLLIYRKRLKEAGINREEFQEKLLADLIHISTLEGDFDLDEETEDHINNWFINHRDTVKGAPEKMHGYYSRKPLMVLKLAMLHSLSTKDELIITKEDFDFGVMAMNSTEPSLKATFAGVGKNEYVLDIMSIIEFIKFKKGCTMKEVLTEFIGVGTKETIEELLKTAIAMGDIIHETRDSQDYFTAT